MKPQGTKRLTPAFAAASTRGSCASWAEALIALITVSIPESRGTSASTLPSRLPITIFNPLSLSLFTEGLLADDGWMKIEMSYDSSAEFQADSIVEEMTSW